ncbi:MAG: hypothetical protein ACFB0E_04360 [Leptolyngbyaceae cyanobacterium]
MVSYEFAADAFGTVIRGRCEFNGRGSLDVGRGSFSLTGLVDEGAPTFDPNRRREIFDINETSLDFELWVPRIGSSTIAAGVDSINDEDFAQTQDVLDIWDALPLDSAPSDFPASGFTLDLIVNAPTVRPPFFQPAKMTPEGLLVSDDDYQEVTLTLPKLRFRLLHSDGMQGSTMQLQLLSAGVRGLDDPGDIRVVEAIAMDPPYAFVGRSRDRFIGFAFRQAVLNLSENITPTAVLEKFGFGDDWAGLYLPEVRLFVAPEGIRDMAFETGVQDLLIGFGDNKGVSGDFEVALINQESGEIQLGARFYDADGNTYDIERLSPDAENAQIQIPRLTRMVVDIRGGRAPYTSTVRMSAIEASEEGELLEGNLVFTIDLEDFETRKIRVVMDDSSFGGSAFAVLSIQARQLNEPLPVLPVPSDDYPPSTEPAVLTPTGETQPRLLIASQTDQTVWVTTEPWNASLLWSVPGSDLPEEQEAAESSIFSVELAPGESKPVQARLPESEVAVDQRDFFFYYNEPKPPQHLANEAAEFANYGSVEKNVWTTPALQEQGTDRELGGSNALAGYEDLLANLPSGAALTIWGDASYDGDNSADDRNYDLAIRRAKVVREIIQKAYPEKNFELTVSTNPEGRAAWTAAWRNRSGGEPVSEINPQHRWRATLTATDSVIRPERSVTAELSRPALPPEPTEIPTADEPPTNTPVAADWFRSAKLKVRVVQDELVAFEIAGEIDLETAAEEQLRGAGQIGGNEELEVRSLEDGQPIPEDVNNPADGITQLRLLAQSDSATGETNTLISIGADPADKNGLAMMGWLPGEDRAEATLGRARVGSYLSFWPLLVDLSDGNQGGIEDAVLDATKLAIPGAIAALPWFTVERVILHGGEYEKVNRNGQSEAFYLFDVEIGWSADIEIGATPLISIDPEYPLTVRYKAIGLRFGDVEGNAPYTLQPVFNASRGYTIDVAKSGALKINGTLGRILRVLSARISRTNPLTFEIDVGMSADLGIVSIERAAVRAYLNAREGESISRPELTALGARVNVPNTLVGSGYLAIDNGVEGQIDLTLVPLNLRISAALAIKNIGTEDGGPATAVYVGIEVILPVGIPLGGSGLGIFGFRGIFGMHYRRNESLGGGATPTLGWLEAADGQPHLLEVNGERLWEPQLNNWAFGLGILIGTIEGGVLMNLDGTFLLELPGPRILIVMTARILSPPPGLDELGASSGLLAVIEITREHFLIGLIADFSIRELISIVIPIEALFGFKDPANWHIYLGSRSNPVTVDVLGIFEGTGYLMLEGDGLPAYKDKLSAIEGFAVGIGAAAALMWGEESDGLYLRVGGGMDAILGFSPFILEGLFEVFGELRLYIISIGAHAELFVSLRETVAEPGEPEPEDRLSLYIRGEACGYIRILWIKLEGCVEITIRSKPDEPPIPQLIKKVSIKSRSPALAIGTGTDRPIDASLGDAVEGEDVPALESLPVVPIDAIPFLSLEMPAQASDLRFFQEPVNGASGAPALNGKTKGFIARGEDKYKYTLKSVGLVRTNANGSVAGPSLVSGSEAPATWWLLNKSSDSNPVAQLALMTWEPTPAPKAIEKTIKLTETVANRWGQICEEAAPPTPVLWTFRYETLGASPLGWDVEGIAWPDSPNTSRSDTPNTSLEVSERWRSGDPVLDGRRGIVAALVWGAFLPCYLMTDAEESGAADADVPPAIIVGGRGPIRASAEGDRGQAVSKDDPVRSQLVRRPNKTPIRVTPRLHKKVSQIADQLSTVSTRQKGSPPVGLASRTIAERLLDGSMGPGELYQAMSAPSGGVPGTPSDPNGGSLCMLKVLQAPQFDNGDAVVFGDPTDETEIAAAIAAAGVTHGPHDDAVRLHTGPFQETTLLLFTWTRLLEVDRVVVRVLDDDDNELDAIALDNSHLLSAQDLPDRWADASGPWADDIDDFLAWATYLEMPGQRLRGLVPVLVKLTDGEAAAKVEISVVPVSDPAQDPMRGLVARYFVAAVECLRLSEVGRWQWDNSEIQRDREIITKILGPESSENALLYPDSIYKIQATWEGERDRDGATASETQTFWFRTDSAPPARLDPWMLMTIPGDKEQHVFYGDPIRLVFNTHDIDRLYDAYGHDLTIRFQAASAHHPPEGPTRIRPPELEPAGADVLSPWEGTLKEVLTNSCIPIDKSRPHQSKIELPILLDPYTDYILDIEAVNQETQTTFSVYRRHFSTGGYRDQAEFASAISAQFIDHRPAKPGSMMAIRHALNGEAPKGAAFDRLWQDQGLEVLPIPEKPRIVVIWEQQNLNSLPQPAAVLIDAPEPLVRSRLYPKLSTGSGAGDDALIPIEDANPDAAERWVLEPKEWLVLSQPAEGQPIANNGQIIVPGSQRALIVLQPNSRGRLLEIDLVGQSFDEAYLNIPEQRYTIVKIRFTHAPWEED